MDGDRERFDVSGFAGGEPGPVTAWDVAMLCAIILGVVLALVM